MVSAVIEGEADAVLAEEARALLDMMRLGIERLADRVQHANLETWETRSRTPAGKRFTTICNGHEKPEGWIKPVPLADLSEMCHETIRSAAGLRLNVTGPALLTWRDINWRPGQSLWVRLAFEPLP